MLRVVLLSVFFVVQVSAKLPAYIKPCSRSAPDFDKCCMTHALEVIPKIVNGDKSLGIPKMNPLKLPKIEISQSNFQFTGKDLSIDGLKDIQVENMKFDFAGKKGYFKGRIPRMEIIGLYEVTGKVLVLNIEGSGPCNITFVDGTYEYSFDFDYEEKKGSKYLKLVNNDLKGNEKRIYFLLENLFNGDQTLVEPLRKLIHDDWEAVAELFRPAIYDFIKQLIGTVTTSFFKKVPEDELFLP